MKKGPGTRSRHQERTGDVAAAGLCCNGKFGINNEEAIKYSILGLAALCTVLLCGGYYMLGYSLKPDDLVSRSRNIAASYDFMYERYPELHPLGG